MTKTSGVYIDYKSNIHLHVLCTYWFTFAEVRMEKGYSHVLGNILTEGFRDQIHIIRCLK